MQNFGPAVDAGADGSHSRPHPSSTRLNPVMRLATSPTDTRHTLPTRFCARVWGSLAEVAPCSHERLGRVGEKVRRCCMVCGMPTAPSAPLRCMQICGLQKSSSFVHTCLVRLKFGRCPHLAEIWMRGAKRQHYFWSISPKIGRTLCSGPAPGELKFGRNHLRFGRTNPTQGRSNSTQIVLNPALVLTLVDAGGARTPKLS